MSFQVKCKYGAFRLFKVYATSIQTFIYSSLVPTKVNDVVNDFCLYILFIQIKYYLTDSWREWFDFCCSESEYTGFSSSKQFLSCVGVVKC